MSIGLSLNLGLNSVDPKHYQGWDGKLAACEYDANDMERIAKSAGFKTTKLLTRQCTRVAVTQAFEQAISTLRGGDIFLVTYSGHGGQLPDRNSDEIDSLDETLCFYDSEWSDDETLAMLKRFAPDVRILGIYDCCHAGTPMKARLLTSRDRGMPPAVAIATYVANKRFYDEILSGESLQRASPLRATAMTIGACQDHQLAADGKFNGRFTGTLKAVWRNGAFVGNYTDFYNDICRRMPPTQIPSLQTEGKLSQTFRQQRPFSIEGTRSMAKQTASVRSASKDNDDPAGAPLSREFAASQLEWGRSRPGEAKPAARSGPGTIPLSDGDYVTSKTASNSLYLFQNNHLEPISPPDAVAAGLGQTDVKMIDPIVLAAYPIEVVRSRDQTLHLWSDLQAGHFMESWGWFEPGKVMVRTATTVSTWFGGFTGGMNALLSRADGTMIPDVDIRASFGVDGTAFGSGRRDETYEWALPQNVLDQADSITFIHYWAPKVDWVAETIKWVPRVIELIIIILGARQQGEPVDAGADVG